MEAEVTRQVVTTLFERVYKNTAVPQEDRDLMKHAIDFIDQCWKEMSEKNDEKVKASEDVKPSPKPNIGYYPKWYQDELDKLQANPPVDDDPYKFDLNFLNKRYMDVESSTSNSGKKKKPNVYSQASPTDDKGGPRKKSPDNRPNY